MVVTRREFLGAAGVMGAIVALASLRKFADKKGCLSLNNYSGAVMPPGAESFSRFTTVCTGCGLCVSSCPGKVLRLDHSAKDGIRSAAIPTLDFSAGFCQSDCNKCASVCPANAIRKQFVEKAEGKVRIGIAEWNASDCAVVRGGGHCGLCAERCPHGAITMESTADCETAHPVVNAALCIGCGACEHYCPAKPKAIKVVGFATQKIAADKS